MAFTGIIRGPAQQAPKAIVYGPPGVGKTTFAAMADKSLLIDTENGAGSVCAPTGARPEFDRSPYLATWPEIRTWLQMVEREQHEYQAIFIDTLDWLMRRIVEHVVSGDSGAGLERTLHKSHGGYGNGKLVLENYIYQQLLPCLDRIVLRGTAVVMIAHARLARISDEGVAVRADAPVMAAPDIADKFLEIFLEWSDLVAYIQSSGADRALVCSPQPHAVAKNRYGINGAIPFSWAAVCQAVGGK